MDSNRTADVKPKVDDIRSWKLADIVDSSQLKALRLPDPLASSKVGSTMLGIFLPNPLVAQGFSLPQKQ